ncbi:MAG: hypothetical protein GW789_10690 [Ignavibacteria bacterium]|nr:hypothetical protein [Ignavibacteria bacterium]
MFFIQPFNHSSQIIWFWLVRFRKFIDVYEYEMNEEAKNVTPLVIKQH